MEFHYRRTLNSNKTQYLVTAIVYPSHRKTPERKIIGYIDEGCDCYYSAVDHISKGLTFNSYEEMLQEIDKMKRDIYFMSYYQPRDFMYQVITVSEDMKI